MRITVEQSIRGVEGTGLAGVTSPLHSKPSMSTVDNSPGGSRKQADCDRLGTVRRRGPLRREYKYSVRFDAGIRDSGIRIDDDGGVTSSQSFADEAH